MPAFSFVSSASDPAVVIGAGWNGPYVRIGAGPSFIRDGWGNSFHVYDGSGAAVTVGNPIAQIASWGSDNAAGGATGYEADVSTPNSDLTHGGFATSATIFGRISMNLALDLPPSANATFSSGPAPNQILHRDTVRFAHNRAGVFVGMLFRPQTGRHGGRGRGESGRCIRACRRSCVLAHSHYEWIPICPQRNFNYHLPPEYGEFSSHSRSKSAARLRVARWNGCFQ